MIPSCGGFSFGTSLSPNEPGLGADSEVKREAVLAFLPAFLPYYVRVFERYLIRSGGGISERGPRHR